MSFHSSNSPVPNSQQSPAFLEEEARAFFSAYTLLPGEEQSTSAYRPRVSTMPSSSPVGREAAMPMRPRRPSVVTLADQMNPEMHRVRSYSVTAKGVTSCSETVRMRHHLRKGVTGSNFSLGSAGSISCISNYSSPRHRSWSYGSSASSSGLSEVNSVTRYHVVVMGTADVGKTSLISQFVSSDFHEGESDEKSVSILLDGEEAELQFVDLKSTADKAPAEEFVLHSDVDAYVIVYSVTDRKSFNAAFRSLKLLNAADLLQEKAVILVGNKIDLERCRSVSTSEGRETATSCGCKFIETSDWMRHNVDELMVGILNQIRLKQEQDTKRTIGSKLLVHDGARRLRSRTLQTASTHEEHLLNYRRSRSVVRDFFKKIHFTSRSCDNLHVL